MFNLRPQSGVAIDQTVTINLSQILFKHQNALAAQLGQLDGKNVELQFDEMYEEIKDLILSVQETASSKGGIPNTFGLPEHLDKLFTEFEI